MRVLFIQQDHMSPTGPVGTAFADHGFDVQEFMVVPEERFTSPGVTVTFPDPLEFDAVVPMGAAWSVTNDERIGSWIGDELDFLRRAHAAGIPVLGICFGGQALAAALGGTVVRAARPEIGWTKIETSRPDLVEPGPWFQWHLDRWILPAGLRAFARTDVADQAFIAGRSMGVQFHPELTSEMLAGWLTNGGRQEVVDLGADPEQLIAETATRSADARARAGRLVTAFLGLGSGAGSGEAAVTSSDE
ncbi:MAG: type 1 glutamine amidotransferase [Actinobacteria bacterium]|nr:type 1 glutamine amidotransferase [Actinomycetota bacterium]